MIVLEKYIQCYCDHQAVYILSKNILTIFFQMKILIGKKKNYILLRVVTMNSFQCNFQYKILRNIYLNKMFFSLWQNKSPVIHVMRLLSIYF